MSRAGILASVRLNPRNVQLTIQLAEKLGIDTHHQSWASIVHAVLASSLSTWVEMGILAEPDPFQYHAQAGRFEGGKNSREKTARNRAAYALAEQGQSAGGMKLPRFLTDSITAPQNSTDSYLRGIEERESAAISSYPADQTEAHEATSDDALAERYLALHRRREAGGLSEGEQAEYLRLNHLLFDGK